MKSTTLTLAICFFLSLSSFAQTNVKLKINHKLNDKAFMFNQNADNNLDHEFNVKRLQYYISNVSIVHDTGKVSPATGVYILANAGQALEVDLGSFDVTNVEAIKFSIGVNTPENHQDPTKWASNHALYPKSPSMHWGWTSGYRFVALEGKTGDQMNKTFEIHALGDENYHKISIPTDATDNNGSLVIELNADYARALENINITSGVITHGDYNEAAELLRNFRDYVFTSTKGLGNTLGVYSIVDYGFKVFPNPSSGIVNFEIAAQVEVDQLLIYDISGKLIQSQSLIDQEVAISIPGLYFAELRKSGQILSRVKLIIQ